MGRVASALRTATGESKHVGNTGMRDIITLACNECKRRNYNTTKNKKKTTERLELKKFCPWCRTHTAHRETK